MRRRKARPKPTFAALVRRWRKHRKLSMVGAADRLGVPYITWQSWEYGLRTPRGLARQLIVAKLSR
jgi:DNA-binding transcriptional regulator YiaG